MKYRKRLNVLNSREYMFRHRAVDLQVKSLRTLRVALRLLRLRFIIRNVGGRNMALVRRDVLRHLSPCLLKFILRKTFRSLEKLLRRCRLTQVDLLYVRKQMKRLIRDPKAHRRDAFRLMNLAPLIVRYVKRTYVIFVDIVIIVLVVRIVKIRHVTIRQMDRLFARKKKPKYRKENNTQAHTEKNRVATIGVDGGTGSETMWVAVIVGHFATTARCDVVPVELKW